MSYSPYDQGLKRNEIIAGGVQRIVTFLVRGSAYVIKELYNFLKGMLRMMIGK